MTESTPIENTATTLSEKNGEVVIKENGSKKKNRPPINYPPYVTGYGSIDELFRQIRQAAVPPKFTQDYMTSVLGMKSSSHRALIPLLKKLGFIDQSNVPTEAYRLFRDREKSQTVMAQQLKLTYSDIYQTHEYAHELTREELLAKLRTLTGAAEDDRNIAAVAATFLELKKLADFSGEELDNSVQTQLQEQSKQSEAEKHSEVKMPSHKTRQANFGISYTINLNLPATNDIEVFNAIFKALKENILYES
jgi:Family of unknown function (DUF5343)